MKHTPGPWLAIVPPSSSPCFRQIVADGSATASDALLAEIIGGENVFQKAANARLIAAAPELLAALEALDGVWLDPKKPIAGEGNRIRDIVNAAIAKATGA